MVLSIRVYSPYVTSSLTFIFLRFTSKIAFLPSLSGTSTKTKWSNLPGLSNALSIEAGLFVAAIIITFFRDSNPSISVSNYIRTLSETSVLPYLYGAMASISSKNNTEGAQILAFLNISLTVFSLSPTYLLKISGPFTAINARLH